MNAVERVTHYRDNIAQESSNESDLPECWPLSGSVTFRDVCMRYRPKLPLSLDRVSLDIRSGEKIGVVGRTGDCK